MNKSITVIIAKNEQDWEFELLTDDNGRHFAVF